MHETHATPSEGALRTAELGQIAVLDELSGRTGTNRAQGRSQISASTDQEAVLAWLARYADSPNTLANSRREAERLLLWSVRQRGKPLSSLTHEDFLIYGRFLADPQPAADWVMEPGRRFGRREPGWRPFAGPLSEASVRQSMTVINSMLTWLVEAGYLAGNPLALSRKRGPSAAPRVTRFLEEDLWAAVRETILAMPRAVPRDRDAYVRVRWLFSLLFIGGLRISEVIGNTMGDFFNRPDTKTGDSRWWIEVLGKGKKRRLVPATTELMVELMHYRRALGLPDLPRQGESAPLLFPQTWKRPDQLEHPWPAQLTRGAVHIIVKNVFAMASARWRNEGRGEAQAEKLKSASAHWMRHTAGSSLANATDIRHARDTLGHANLSTTSVYVHSEDDVRHAAVSAVHSIRWAEPSGPEYVAPK